MGFLLLRRLLLFLTFKIKIFYVSLIYSLYKGMNSIKHKGEHMSVFSLDDSTGEVTTIIYT